MLLTAQSAWLHLKINILLHLKINIPAALSHYLAGSELQ